MRHWHSLTRRFVYILETEIIKLAKGENDSQLSKITQCEQDTYEMQVRAANIGKLMTVRGLLAHRTPGHVPKVEFFAFDYSSSRRIIDQTGVGYQTVPDSQRFPFGQRCNRSQFHALSEHTS